MDSSNILNLVLAIPAIIAALTVHEFAHAWMANRLGDDTAQRLGRLTLDPLKHLDPLGTLMIVLGSLVGFFFGWAKPVPFNMRNLENPRRDAMLIAIAGPISNLLQVPIWLAFYAILYRVAMSMNLNADMTASIAVFLLQMLQLGVVINISLAVFNMIPIPPLDGHYVLEGLGPPSITDFFNMIRPYSFIILLVLLNMPGRPLTQILIPARNFAYSLLDWASGQGWS